MKKHMDLSTYIEKLEQIKTDNPLIAGLAEAMAEKARIESGLVPAKEPETSEPVDGNSLLHDLTRFISRYLHCSERQRTILALWVLHTYCLPAAQATPFLAIQSIDKQSGKTLCLQLLDLLCNSPVLTANIDRRIIGGHLHSTDTLLFDQCYLTLGTRFRSRKPTLRALLASSSHSGLLYDSESNLDRIPFRAKAFATIGELPEDIADRSIPIILEPLRRNEGRWFRPNGIQRFDLRRAQPEAESLKQRLSAWSQQHLGHIEQLPAYAEESFPNCVPSLTPRRMQLVEPLLQLADVIGGPWPNHIRQALEYIFDDGDTFHLYPSRQLLEDIYIFFSSHCYPERVPTAFLLDWLNSQQNRSWQAEGPINPYRLAQLLGVFDISPRLQRMGEKLIARGYQLADFQPAWRRYMAIELRQDLDHKYYPVDLRAEYDALRQELKRRNSNKDAPCNGVTHNATVVSAEQNPTPTEAQDHDFGNPSSLSSQSIPSTSSTESSRLRTG